MRKKTNRIVASTTLFSGCSEALEEAFGMSVSAVLRTIGEALGHSPTPQKASEIVGLMLALKNANAPSVPVVRSSPNNERAASEGGFGVVSQPADVVRSSPKETVVALVQPPAAKPIEPYVFPDLIRPSAPVDAARRFTLPADEGDKPADHDAVTERLILYVLKNDWIAEEEEFMDRHDDVREYQMERHFSVCFPAKYHNAELALAYAKRLGLPSSFWK